MPAKSAKQERFMQAVAHNPAFAKKVGVSQSVGREFTKGSKMKKYQAGGMPAASNKGGAMRGIQRAAAMSGRPTLGSQRVTTMKAGGLAAGHKSADGVATKGKTKGKQIAMKMGGKVKGCK